MTNTIRRCIFLGILFFAGTARAQESPVGAWKLGMNGRNVDMQVAEVNPETGELSGTMTHPTTGKPDRIMGFWDGERRHVSFYRVADSDEADPRYGQAYAGYLVDASGPAAGPMLVGSVKLFTPGAGATRQTQEVGWYAVRVPAPPEASAAPPAGGTSPTAARKAWLYEAGWFETKDGQSWFELNRDIHNDSLDGFRFRETGRTPDFVELLDEGRDLVVRLFADHAEWRRSSETEWFGLVPGRWLDGPPTPAASASMPPVPGKAMPAVAQAGVTGVSP